MNDIDKLTIAEEKLDDALEDVVEAATRLVLDACRVERCTYKLHDDTLSALRRALHTVSRARDVFEDALAEEEGK